MHAIETSLRNRLKGKIAEIVRGDVVSEVDIETTAGSITAIVTTRSIDRLKLQVGDEVHALIKATNVSVEKR